MLLKIVDQEGVKEKGGKRKEFRTSILDLVEIFLSLQHRTNLVRGYDDASILFPSLPAMVGFIRKPAMTLLAASGC